MALNCQQLKTDLITLKNSKAEFELAIKDGKKKRDFSEAWRIKKQMQALMNEIESMLGIVAVERARKIMGDEFFGFQEVEKAFGIRISPEDVPEIPFSREELERAKELNQFLVLRVDKAPDGKPLTFQKINEILKGKVSDGSKLLYSDDGKGGIKDDAWYKDEAFIKDETARLSWALVSREVIPDSTSKNYLEQTEELANYLKNQVFKGIEMPGEYQEAIKEFKKEKAGIGKIIFSKWQKAAEKLSQLKINQLTRQNSAEVLYDIAIYFQNRRERILENRYTWTSRRASDGRLVLVGYFGPAGVHVYSRTPVHSDRSLGVAFSRLR